MISVSVARRSMAAAVIGVTALSVGSASAHSSKPQKNPAQQVKTNHSASAAVPAVSPQCTVSGRSTVSLARVSGPLTKQWEVASPPDDTTYDLSGVTSTAYPSSHSPVAVGTGSPGARTCIIGGSIAGRAVDSQTWEYYHSNYNAACVKIRAKVWMVVQNVRCDNVEDGFRPKETGKNTNDGAIYIRGTYLSKIRDDCIENDSTLGGVLADSLWLQCNTGISEQPSSNQGSWTSPANETLTLDHMLIGLYKTPHIEHGQQVLGENALFKWSGSANHLVIKCSIFKVDSVSLNGKGAMKVPTGTVIDDSACPGNPSTIVWLGGGQYPAATAGMRVTSDISVWENAVGQWKSAHGF